MAKEIRIKRGLDIPLAGGAEGTPSEDTRTTVYGIVPDDFPGHTWKARVKPGDKVRKGDVLLSDKATDSIALVSPVAGKVLAIVRGERRKIEAVTVDRDRDSDLCKEFDTKPEREAIHATLRSSGLWALMRQRPFDIVPEAESVPRDIFITAFDSSPLAPEVLSTEDLPYLETGVKILSMLTEGKVYLATRPDAGADVSGAEMLHVSGPHPAGNVGVQIAAVRPVNKGETVWCLSARTVARIGRLYSGKGLDTGTTVAVTGPMAAKRCLIDTRIGAKLSTLLEGCLPAGMDDIRVISGNVLTGVKVDPAEAFLRFPYRQVSVIKEGGHADEFMGWASLKPSKFSVKRSFPNFLHGLHKAFPFDARIKGGHRAMILSEEYDKVFPFDIYPEFLLKAIIASDIDRMEKLGIYEVAPEDFALPEFIDTSKLALQKTVREGLDMLRAEG